MKKTSMATRKIQAMLKRLGEGTMPEGAWNKLETEFVLASPIRIRVEKCENATLCNHTCDIQRVMPMSIIGRGVVFRDKYEISTTNIEFKIVK